MKKIIISWLFCFATVYLFGQEFCMYQEGQKICSEISATRFILGSITSDAGGIKDALQQMEVGSVRNIYDVDAGLFVVEMQDISKDELLELRRQLNAREDLEYTSPLFVDERGLELSTYKNEVIVCLKSKDDYPILQQSAVDYSISKIRQPAFDIDGRAYILTLPHNSEKDAAEISIELYETNLYEFAEPNVITLCPFESCPFWWASNTFIDREQTTAAYPNPVSDMLHVDLSQKTAVSYDIRLYNTQGKICRQIMATGEIAELNVAALPEGVYLLSIRNESSSKQETHKIIVKHGNH